MCICVPVRRPRKNPGKPGVLSRIVKFDALLKSLVFIMALLPFLNLVLRAFNDELGVNPVETLVRTTGDWAFYFLLITLSVTPLVKLAGLNRLMKLRRMLGLFVFFYACLHVISYVWFDQYFDWEGIFRDIVKRPFITLGFIAFMILSLLAFTSTNKMMWRLKKNWKRLHQLIYPLSLIVMLHYFMMIKADYQQPLLFLIVLMLLLAYRIRRPKKYRSV